MTTSCAFWVNCIFGFGICVSEVCPSTCSRRLLLHITLPPETSPTWERWGPLKLRNGRYFCALCQAGTCSLVIATRSVTVHLGRSSAFLLWPCCLPSPSLHRASTTFPLAQSCTRYPRHRSSRKSGGHLQPCLTSLTVRATCPHHHIVSTIVTIS